MVSPEQWAVILPAYSVRNGISNSVVPSPNTSHCIVRSQSPAAVFSYELEPRNQSRIADTLAITINKLVFVLPSVILDLRGKLRWPVLAAHVCPLSHLTGPELHSLKQGPM